MGDISLKEICRGSVQIAAHGFRLKKSPCLKLQSMPQAIREPFLSPCICVLGCSRDTHDMIVKMVFPVMHGREKRKNRGGGDNNLGPLSIMSLNHVDHKKIKVRLPRGIFQGLLLLALQSPCLFSSQSLKKITILPRALFR